MRKAARDFFRKGDMLLLALCLCASVMGLFLIYSATRCEHTDRYVVVQAVGILIGVVCYVVLTMVDVEHLTAQTWWGMVIFNILIFLALIPFGRWVGGNRNWIALPGLPVNIQPNEIVKLFFVVVMAYQCTKLRERELLSHPIGVGSLLFHTLFFAGLNVVISRDYGMSLVYIFIFLIMAWCAGVKWWWFVIGLGAVAGGGAMVWGHLPDRIRDRVLVIFLRNDPQGIGWQQDHSVMAIGSGGLTGQGYLQGYQTQQGAIPAQSTDEIFAVCGEELGMVGCAVVLLLLTAIILRCFWVGRRAASPMTALVAMGYGGMFLCQTLVNIAMCLYVFPVVGLTLPFFSYGGTSIITLFMAAGMVSGVKARDLPSWLQDRNGA